MLTSASLAPGFHWTKKPSSGTVLVGSEQCLTSKVGGAPPSHPPIITYHLEVDEQDKGPVVSREWLRWTRKKGKAGRPFNFLDFTNGRGWVISGEMPDEDDERVEAWDGIVREHLR